MKGLSLQRRVTTRFLAFRFLQRPPVGKAVQPLQCEEEKREKDRKQGYIYDLRCVLVLHYATSGDSHESVTDGPTGDGQTDRD